VKGEKGQELWVLFSRQVIGWSMKPQMTSDLAIDVLLMGGLAA